VSERLGISASVFNPKANATAAAYYMGRLERVWYRRRTLRERQKLAQASYNAGTGNILRAQEECNDALIWEEIEPCLGYEETRTYIIRIERWYKELEDARKATAKSTPHTPFGKPSEGCALP
jgi:membrane-bound lytic murein transglycosylase F